MKSILHVKNFGPIKDAKLDLRNVNVLIGPQASGKSTLAKLFTICKSPVMFFELDGGRFTSINASIDILDIKSDEPSYEKFLHSLTFFSIGEYVRSNTEISFVSSTHSIFIKDQTIKFVDNLKFQILLDAYSNEDFPRIEEFIINLTKKTESFESVVKFGLFASKHQLKQHFFYDSIGREDFLKFRTLKMKDLINVENIPFLIETALNLRDSIFNNDATYIPSERTLVNLIKQASLNFQRSNIPLPGHLLDYAAKYESASFSIKKFDLSFISPGAEYRDINGEDRVFFSDKESVKLTDSASGFQSVIPMLLPLQDAFDNSEWNHSTFIIEEPETNLFPSAQYEVIKFIEKGRKNDFGMIDDGAMHIYTTHSPFILSSLNNMLFGFKKGNKAPDSVKYKIGKVIPEENWINPDDFSAYEIKNGKAKSIFSRKTGLISETVIDVVSEDIMNDFRKIAVISAEANVEK